MITQAGKSRARNALLWSILGCADQRGTTDRDLLQDARSELWKSLWVLLCLWGWKDRKSRTSGAGGAFATSAGLWRELQRRGVLKKTKKGVRLSRSRVTWVGVDDSTGKDPQLQKEKGFCTSERTFVQSQGTFLLFLSHLLLCCLFIIQFHAGRIISVCSRGKKRRKYTPAKAFHANVVHLCTQTNLGTCVMNIRAGFTADPFGSFGLALSVILDFLWPCLILCFSPNAVIKRLSQPPAFSFLWLRGSSAFFTCFSPVSTECHLFHTHLLYSRLPEGPPSSPCGRT